MSALHGVQNALVLRCPCDILPLFVLQPKIQLRFRFIFHIYNDNEKDFFYEVLELFISSKLSRQNFALQSVAYCHKDSLFKDKVKPIQMKY